MAWRWGNGAFQRIYVDNNREASPTAQNKDFRAIGGTWNFPGNRSLSSQFLLGSIANQGSCVGEDAHFDTMDVEIDTRFDPEWHRSGK